MVWQYRHRIVQALIVQALIVQALIVQGLIVQGLFGQAEAALRLPGNCPFHSGPFHSGQCRAWWGEMLTPPERHQPVGLVCQEAG